MRPTSLAAAGAAGLALALAATVPATAASDHGRSIGLVRGAHASLNASESSNWSGYNKGILDNSGGFHSITGQWTVPTATQHTRGQDEYSSSWIGIGGGCLDTSCSATDSTLIQAGTEQDVAADGTASYSTWYELIPAPSISTPLAVKAGDVVSAAISESVPEVWTISLKNVTTGKSWSTTVPYSSSYATAEWIEETPLTFGTSGAGLSSLPNLGTVHFDLATVNGGNAALDPAEEMVLTDSNGSPIATPSAPDAEADGFNDCTWSTTCAAP
ncbi:MAG TPA: G1 family glutamic endopeptidase [Mycobacteriales bacterium]|nr:G1 family glutamic endopeptidase [Mycobacteriales bacterium]